MYNSAIVKVATGELTKQAMPDTHKEDNAYVPYRTRSACGMDPEPGTQIGRIHTTQLNRQHSAITTYTRPRVTSK